MHPIKIERILSEAVLSITVDDESHPSLSITKNYLNLEKMRMSNGEVIRHTPPSVITGPLTDEELAGYFYRRSDLTYRKLESLTLTNLDMYQSLLTGALIRN